MYTMGNLSFDERPTGIIFGFLNQILQLAIRFDYPRFIFAWDSKRSCRRDVYPNYKQKDKEITQDMLELLGISKPQFSTLRIQVLPRIGFANNFIQTGLEADDIIAMIVKDLYHKEVYIISSDNDLYQLLLPTHNLYDPKKKTVYGFHDFFNEWNVLPNDWPKIKALAGCNGDNVKGLPGVGEKTAIKWLKGNLKGKKADIISQNSTKMYLTNLPLVSLPHKDTIPITLQQDRLNFPEFEVTCLEYGFRSFLKKGVYEKWQKILS
jgi:DNA polymerase-1